MYLVIYADKQELPNIEWKLLDKGILKKYKFFKYIYKNKEIIVVECGIGVVAASACVELFCEKYNPSIVFNFGAVGASSKLKRFDLVIPKYIYYHDVITPWYPRGKVPYQPEKFVNGYSSPNNINLATGMMFLDTKEKLSGIQDSMDVDIFDMEAAAIAQICNKNNIQLIVIKAVSDIIGNTNTDRKNINEYIKLAGMKSFQKMDNIIKKRIK